MVVDEARQRAVEAKRLLSYAFKMRISDGFGIYDHPAGLLIQTVFANGRGKSHREHLAIKLECGMSVMHAGRPSRTVMSGDWLIITPEIMATELLRYSEWEFEDCGKILAGFPGAVSGNAQSEYLGFRKLRKTISIPMYLLMEHFPELQPKKNTPPLARTTMPRKKRTPKAPSRLNSRQAGRARKLRIQGYKVEKIAEIFGVATVDVHRAWQQYPAGRKKVK